MGYNPRSPAWGILTWPRVEEFNLANGGNKDPVSDGPPGALAAWHGVGGHIPPRHIAWVASRASRGRVLAPRCCGPHQPLAPLSARFPLR